MGNAETASGGHMSSKAPQIRLTTAYRFRVLNAHLGAAILWHYIQIA